MQVQVLYCAAMQMIDVLVAIRIILKMIIIFIIIISELKRCAATVIILTRYAPRVRGRKTSHRWLLAM